MSAAIDHSLNDPWSRARPVTEDLRAHHVLAIILDVDPRTVEMLDLLRVAGDELVAQAVDYRGDVVSLAPVLDLQSTDGTKRARRLRLARGLVVACPTARAVLRGDLRTAADLTARRIVISGDLDGWIRTATRTGIVFPASIGATAWTPTFADRVPRGWAAHVVSGPVEVTR